MKILILHHNDLDGCVAAMVIMKAYGQKNCKRLHCNSFEQNNKAEQQIQKAQYYDKVFILDLPIDTTIIAKAPSNVYFFDHHIDSYDVIFKKKTWILEKDKSVAACKQVYRIFEKKYPKVKELKNLVEEANSYDIWSFSKKWLTAEHFKIDNIPLCVKLNSLYFEIWSDKFINQFYDGALNLDRNSLLFLEKKYKYFEEIVTDLNPTWLDENLKVLFTLYQDMPNEVGEYLKLKFGANFIILCNWKWRIMSIRINEKSSLFKEFNLGQMLSKSFKKIGGVSAGGHRYAGGIKNVSSENMKEVLDTLMREVNENVNK